MLVEAQPFEGWSHQLLHLDQVGGYRLPSLRGHVRQIQLTVGFALGVCLPGSESKEHGQCSSNMQQQDLDTCN